MIWACDPNRKALDSLDSLRSDQRDDAQDVTNVKSQVQKHGLSWPFAQTGEIRWKVI